MGTVAAAAHARARRRDDHHRRQHDHHCRRPRRRRVGRLGAVEHAVGGPAGGQRGCRDRVGEVSADPVVLRPAKAGSGSRRGRRRQVGCLLAGNDRRVLRGHVLLRPADAPGPQGADGVDPFVVGRHADRLMDQRTVARRRPAARAVPFLLAERHPAVPGEREPLRAEPEEMGSEADRRGRVRRRRWVRATRTSRRRSTTG